MEVHSSFGDKIKLYLNVSDIPQKQKNLKRMEMLFWAMTLCRLVGWYQGPKKHTASNFKTEEDGNHVLLDDEISCALL
jgi:hypothetical protein